MTSPIRETVTVGAVEISLETGWIAPQAAGSVVLRQGETVILAAVSRDESPRKLPFLPLTVEYREPMAAAGRVPGSYLRREARPSDRETLTSRLIDRTVRALFPKLWRHETQLFVTVMSHDADSDAGALGIIAAAAALHISDIPWDGPAGGVRVVGHGASRGTGGESALIALPTVAERKGAELDVIVSAGPGGLVMVEGDASCLPEARLVEALEHAVTSLDPVFATLDRLRAAAGKEKLPAPEAPAEPDAVAKARAAVRAPLGEALRETDRTKRRAAIQAVEATAVADARGGLGEDADDDAAEALERAVKDAARDVQHELIRRMVLDEGRRLDGRSTDDVREITVESGYLPKAHGSAVFTRGQTQAIVTATLGGERDGQDVESPHGVTRSRFLLHYNFPPYSVGEVRPLRGPGRREIGHGHLARRALLPVLPDKESFPYVMRVVSDITSSNGSSSMASVCGGCLALLDAGVPLAATVAGVAMGLVHDGEKTAVLTDILGDEDHHGDMDFKVAGTAAGITALQLDNKMGQVPRPLLEQALEQARRARVHIIERMEASLPKERKLSKNAPRAATRKIRRNRIRDLIGAGGKVIQGISRETGVQIDVDDDGNVTVFAQAGADMDEALRRIDEVTGEPKVGVVYEGTVSGVKDFGTFVRLFGSVEGFLSREELARDEQAPPRDRAKIKVLVRGVDERGRVALTRRLPQG